MEENDYIGYMKFYGENVANGVIQADVAGAALLGFDECIKFFNRKQIPAINLFNYKIPVKTEEGSWIVWVLGAAGTGVGIFVASYLKKAGEKMAENDFKDIGISDVIGKSIDAIRNLVELIKHKKGNLDWKNENHKIEERDGGYFVLIKNDNGQVIYIPVEQYEWFKDMPKKSLEKMVQGVATGQNLSIGVKKNDKFESTEITLKERELFLSAEEDEVDEIVFPELEHGSYAQLEGKLIRGNEKTNSLGFEYIGVILNCHPEKGSIRQYKSALFLKCIIRCYISRAMKNNQNLDKKPTLFLENVEPLESDQFELF